MKCKLVVKITTNNINNSGLVQVETSPLHLWNSYNKIKFAQGDPWNKLEHVSNKIMRKVTKN